LSKPKIEVIAPEPVETENAPKQENAFDQFVGFGVESESNQIPDTSNNFMNFNSDQNNSNPQPNQQTNNFMNFGQPDSQPSNQDNFMNFNSD
jgi:hypothetical protein